MLKITKKTEYALIALTHIKGNQDSLISSKDIAKHYNVPVELMAKTLQIMARVGYIKAIKGSRGGYHSNGSLNNISLKQFIESLEGPLAISDCSSKNTCQQLPTCNIKEPIKRINDNLLTFLDSISVVEITK